MVRMSAYNMIGGGVLSLGLIAGLAGCRTAAPKAEFDLRHSSVTRVAAGGTTHLAQSPRQSDSRRPSDSRRQDADGRRRSSPPIPPESSKTDENKGSSSSSPTPEVEKQPTRRPNVDASRPLDGRLNGPDSVGADAVRQGQPPVRDDDRTGPQAAAVAPAYSVPDPAIQQALLAIPGAVMAAPVVQDDAGSEFTESLFLSEMGTAGLTGLTAPPTTLSGQTTSLPNLQRGDPTSFTRAGASTIQTPQLNRLTGPGGGCESLSRAGFFTGSVQRCRTRSTR